MKDLRFLLPAPSGQLLTDTMVDKRIRFVHNHYINEQRLLEKILKNLAGHNICPVQVRVTRKKDEESDLYNYDIKFYVEQDEPYDNELCKAVEDALNKILEEDNYVA